MNHIMRFTRARFLRTIARFIHTACRRSPFLVEPSAISRATI